MADYENHYSKVIDFLKKYESLIDCHLVDFLTKNLWQNCLPKNLRLYIENERHKVINEIEQFNECPANKDSELSIFLAEVKSLRLEYCQSVISRNKILETLNYQENLTIKPIESEFMKVKKWHEVDVFTKTIVWLNKEKPSIIIDAGSGKGYSSLHLSNCYNFPVLAIESSESNHKSAIVHKNLVNKRQKEISSLIHYAVARIDNTTDFIQMVKNNFPDLYLKNRELVMTALHACGSLTDSVIKSFLNVTDIKCLCVVPCCYHLASEAFSSDYEFSKNLRMLAQQSVDRVQKKNETLSPSLFYRAVLQVILWSLGTRDTKIGRGAPLNDFLTYAQWALKKINILEVPSNEVLENIYEEYKFVEWKFNVFQLLRIQLAPVIEAAIILDKIIYLQKSKVCATLDIVQLFDPLKSPRNYAIIARK